MTIEDELKSLIEANYRNLRQFSLESGIPYSTVDTVLRKGVQKAHITSVFRICKALGISADALADGRLELASEEHAGAVTDPHKTAQIGIDLNEAEVSLLSDFRELNEEGQGKLTDYASDLVASGRYIKSDAPVMVAPSAGA